MAIENERQYAVTRRQIEVFEQALRDHDAATRPPAIVPALWRAERDALESQLEDLRAEAAAWERRKDERSGETD